MDAPERERLLPYVHLLDEFLSGRIDATTFDGKYEQAYLKDQFDWSDGVFHVLDELFAEADAFCEDPKLRDSSIGDNGPAELKRACEVAREKLQRLMG